MFSLHRHYAYFTLAEADFIHLDSKKFSSKSWELESNPGPLRALGNHHDPLKISKLVQSYLHFWVITSRLSLENKIVFHWIKLASLGRSNERTFSLTPYRSRRRSQLNWKLARSINFFSFSRLKFSLEQFFLCVRPIWLFSTRCEN